MLFCSLNLLGIHVLLLIILLYTVYDTVYTAVISSNKSYINSTNIYKSYKNVVEVYNSVTFYTNPTCMLQKLTIQKYFKPTPTDMLQKNMYTSIIFYTNPVFQELMLIYILVLYHLTLKLVLCCMTKSSFFPYQKTCMMKLLYVSYNTKGS